MSDRKVIFHVSTPEASGPSGAGDRARRMTPCPLCLHRTHQPGQCATPSIDGCTCGMTRRQQRGHYRRLRIAEQLEDLADRVRYWGRP